MSSLTQKFETDGYLFIKNFFSDCQVQVLLKKLEENCGKIIQVEDAGFSIPQKVIINRESFDHGKIKQGISDLYKPEFIRFSHEYHGVDSRTRLHIKRTHRTCIETSHWRKLGTG